MLDFGRAKASGGCKRGGVGPGFILEISDTPLLFVCSFLSLMGYFEMNSEIAKKCSCKAELCK